MKCKITIAILTAFVLGGLVGWTIGAGVISFGKKQANICESPDKNGCCPGEEYTDMGELGFNCCPPEGDCFPPIK